MYKVVAIIFDIIPYLILKTISNKKVLHYNLF